MNDIAIAAAAPITGSASTPNDIPTASAGSANGSAARTPRTMPLGA
jgi:hypothetical protein